MTFMLFILIFVFSHCCFSIICLEKICKSVNLKIQSNNNILWLTRQSKRTANDIDCDYDYDYDSECDSVCECEFTVTMNLSQAKDSKENSKRKEISVAPVEDNLQSLTKF